MTEVSKEDVASPAGPVQVWRLRSSAASVEILSLGCVIKSIRTPDRSGRSADIVLGYDHIEDYFSNPRYFGAVVGRVANRIAKGRFTIGEKEYKLAINNGPNALHGGLRGFNKALWRSEAVNNGVKLSHHSPDGDEGYPGNLDVSVTYTLEDNTLSLLYHAQTDQATPVNLTNHSYFNLAGQGTPDIYDHEVAILADAYLPVDDTVIPTGEVKPVSETLFDLRRPVLLGPRLKELPGPGFDHNFCLCSPGEQQLERKCARMVHPGTGRVLEVSTNQPGIQFYTSNFLDGTLKGKDGTFYSKHSAFCFETQNWPDAINQAHFPDVLLGPDKDYKHTTHFTFSVA